MAGKGGAGSISRGRIIKANFCIYLAQAYKAKQILIWLIISPGEMLLTACPEAT